MSTINYIVDNRVGRCGDPCAAAAAVDGGVAVRIPARASLKTNFPLSGTRQIPRFSEKSFPSKVATYDTKDVRRKTDNWTK